jgi:hypothetical protein
MTRFKDINVSRICFALHVESFKKSALATRRLSK